MSNFDYVKTFMHAFGQEIKPKAGFPNQNVAKLHYDLISEELSELNKAMESKNLLEVATLLA